MSTSANELRNRRRNHEQQPPSASAKGETSTRKLLTWDEIPQWQRDNEYIIYGYRGELNSWRRSFSSAFTYLHNETVNIQSHWIGGLIFIGMWLYHLRGVYKQYGDTINTFDKLYMSFFMIGALFCLFISGSYHMISSHSKPVSDVFHRLDYAGIVILTVGSFYPAVYYGFFCDPHFAVLWLVLLTISGAGAAYAVLSPTYSTPEYRRTRAYLFITLGLGGALPIVHLWATEGFSHLVQIGIDWLLASAGFYIGGAILYSERFPERIWPGRFDLIGASHQVFHVCVVLAAVCHYISMLRCIEFWHGEHHGHCGIFRK